MSVRIADIFLMLTTALPERLRLEGLDVYPGLVNSHLVKGLVSKHLRAGPASQPALEALSAAPSLQQVLSQT